MNDSTERFDSLMRLVIHCFFWVGLKFSKDDGVSCIDFWFGKRLTPTFVDERWYSELTQCFFSRLHYA
jgi:hypothetical protein